MNWLHVVLGIVAGMAYSIFGWLKNVKESEKNIPDEKEIAKWIQDLESVKDRGKAIESFVRTIYESYRDYLFIAMAKFNPREFFITVLQGLVIGIFMGLLNLPVDIAVSLATQTGILTLVRKIAVIVKP